jgi:hypothetical protein
MRKSSERQPDEYVTEFTGQSTKLEAGPASYTTATANTVGLWPAVDILAPLSSLSTRYR